MELLEYTKLEYKPLDVELPDISSISDDILQYSFMPESYVMHQTTTYETPITEQEPVEEQEEKPKEEITPKEYKEKVDLKGDLSKESKQGVFPKSEDGRISFHKTMFNAYQKTLTERGIDPEWAYILTASASIESAYGHSLGAHYNYGGVKVTDGQRKKGIPHMWSMTPDWLKDENGNLYIKRRMQPFRAYSSIEDYCNRVITLLSNSRYNMFNRYNPHEYVKTWYHILDSGYAKSDYNNQMKYARTLGDRVQTIKKHLKI